MTGKPKPSSFMRQKINRRLVVLYAFIILVFVLLLSRLFFLQVVHGTEYQTIAENNSYRVVSLPARRGDIADRNGNSLASSEPYMSVKVYLEEVDDKEALSEQLSDLFNRSDIYNAEQEARDKLNSSTLVSAIAAANDMTVEDYLKKRSGGSSDDGDTDEDDNEDDDNSEEGSLTINEMTTPEDVLDMLNTEERSYEGVTVRTYTYAVGVQVAQIVSENRDKFPGVTVVEEPMRTYPFGYHTGHVLGTVGKISESQYTELGELFNYKITDVIGKSGLESYYERYTENGKEIGLRGKDGSRVVEVDSLNNVKAVISEESPTPGNSLITTIDLNTQIAMDNALSATVRRIADTTNPKCTGGSAVLLDVKTGGVLAMSSYPFTDPNDFSQGLSQEEANYYFSDKQKPQFNRAISAVYPSGSTFKLVTATAILKAGLSPYATVNCAEWYWEGLESMASCWKQHGTVDFHSATAGSCNSYFQTMAAKAGEETLLDVGRAYGFGQTTNIDLPGEKTGLLPTPEWKAENFMGWDSNWHLYDTYYTSIGQGATEDTVIQLASYSATIANGGIRMQPYIVSQIVDDDGVVLKQFEPQTVGDMELTADQIQRLVDAMKGVVADEGGTAVNLFDMLPANQQPAAKTGTAQTGQVGDNPNYDYHGVFIAFAPADDPQVAFASVIEYGTHGGTSAGKVAAATFAAYFGYDVEPGIIVSSNQ